MEGSTTANDTAHINTEEKGLNLSVLLKVIGLETLNSSLKNEAKIDPNAFSSEANSSSAEEPEHAHSTIISLQARPVRSLVPVSARGAIEATATRAQIYLPQL